MRRFYAALVVVILYSVTHAEDNIISDDVTVSDGSEDNNVSINVHDGFY